MRFIHLIVVAALVAAAVHVYKIKFEATVQAERVAHLRAEIRREHDTIATLRAEWARIDNPARIQALAQRHLTLKPLDPTQVESLDHVPEKPAALPPAPEPLADAVARSDAARAAGSTGSVSTGSVPAHAVEAVPVETGSIETGSIETVPVATGPEDTGPD